MGCVQAEPCREISWHDIANEKLSSCSCAARRTDVLLSTNDDSESMIVQSGFKASANSLYAVQYVRFPWPSGKGTFNKTENGVNAEGRSTMQKSTDFRSAVVILAMLFGLLAPNYADAVEDFSGDWEGTWWSITHSRGGTLNLSLTQNGVLVVGTFTLTGGFCSPISNQPLTGNVNGSILSFDATITCGGVTGIWESRNGVLTNNRLLADHTYKDEYTQGEGYSNLTRSINFINASAGSGGTIVPEGKISVTAGTDYTFNILPDDEYKILDVIVDGVSIGAVASYTFTNVSANHTIMATFEAAPNNFINATAGSGGTIVPEGTVSVTTGTNQTFNILPDDGFKIRDVIVDGVSIGAEASYTFTNVSANHTIMATFEAAPSITTGDLNGDNRDDLAEVTASEQVRYSTNLTTWTDITGELETIVCGDLDGDGNDDLAGVNSIGQVWYTTDRSSWNNIPGTVAAIVTGDLDGDGDDDIAGINPDGASAKVFYTTDLSSWTPIPGLITSIVTGDLDGDGDDDIAGINPDGMISKIFYTTDLSTWTPIPGLITLIITGDLDGDGDDDIAGINPDGMISKIFYTTDLSTWTPIPGLITSIVAGDFDGDGDDDIAGINPDGVSAKIFYTNDLVNWNIIPGALDMITAGDLDADGDDDLAGVNISTSTIWYTTDLATWTNIP